MRSRPDRRSRLRDVAIGACFILVPLVVLALIDVSEPGRIALLLIAVVFGVLRLGYLCWQLATGRYRRARRRARAQAEAQQQRLEAALSHGPYRPQPAPPPSGERERARQELLEAAERYGSLSPQARTAAEKVKRLSG